MPYQILDDGLSLHYQIDGLERGPTLIFSNSLGTNLHMWDAQVEVLRKQFRILRYDTRGHAESGVPTGPATIDRLGLDLISLLDRHGIDQTHICGLSLGGLTAQWVALHHPARVSRLILANTAARIGSVESWSTRIDLVQQGGLAAIRDLAMGRFFNPSFRAANPAIVAIYAERLLANRVAGYCACCAALRDADLRDAIGQIKAPTLVIGSTLDETTPLAQAHELHSSIPHSQLAILESAHISNVEQPYTFTQLIVDWLAA
ncbi:MAG: 3-oxoadipate enol-lactonase [Roseiflexaceae bacterium]